MIRPTTSMGRGSVRARVLRWLALSSLALSFGCDADSVTAPDLPTPASCPSGIAGGGPCQTSCPAYAPNTFEPANCTGSFTCDYADRSCVCGGAMLGLYCVYKVDMSANRIGCKSYAACMSDCFANNPVPTLSNCTLNCDQHAKISGFAKWEPMAECARTYGSIPVDRLGDPAGTCKRCLANAIAAGNGTFCSDTSGADCNPAVCKEVTDACLSDLP